MKKSFLLLILLFLFSCSNSSDTLEKEENDILIDDIENINLNESDILLEFQDEKLIDDTTEEDIDELIDILFDTNNN
jgi:thioredoxin-related protein